jgi:hypothetical protein
MNAKTQINRMPITFCRYTQDGRHERIAEGHLDSISRDEALDRYVGQTLPFCFDNWQEGILDEVAGGMLTPTMFMGAEAPPFYHFTIESADSRRGTLTLTERVESAES